MKRNLIKKIIKCMATTAFVFVSSPLSVYGLVIHENRTEQRVANGVTYELNRQVTNRGLLDIHVLRIDMESPGITLGPAIPQEYGTRHTTSNLLQSNGAVAGINADFFDMSANPATPMGQVVQHGNIISVNGGEAGYATFFVGEYNNPFIRYIRPEIIFLNNGNRNIAVQTINKFERNFSSALFNRQTIYNTAGLDSRFSDLVKLVVEDDIITHISEPGETVSVPENGYIIVMSLRYSQYFTESIRVGDSAELRIDASVDLDNVISAIGGAGTILENGTLSNSGFVVAPNARHPRSAVGISQDGTEVILVAVDGRSHSVGATHSEMATIMRNLGAYTAMHLDGGGSTTMAAQTMNHDHVRVVNTVSDGSQRRVVNALGVYNNSTPGEITSLTINTYPNRVFHGSGVNVYPFALDGHLNRMDINWEYAALVSDDAGGVWDGNRFFPSRIGEINFTLMYRDLTYVTSIQSMELASITPSVTTLSATGGQRIPLNFTGTSTMGHAASILNLNFEVVPASLGYIENNVFVVNSNESGYIRANIGNISTYIGVNISGQTNVRVPVSTPFVNPFNRSLQSVPSTQSFDITFVGNVTIGEDVKPYEYLEIQSDSLLGFAQNSARGIFVGRSDISEIHGLQLGRWSSGYSFDVISNVALINLDASRGALTSTSAYNWSFVNELRNSNVDHVIIQMDRSAASLTSAIDRQMFQEALEQIAASGKNVFVISPEGLSNTTNIINGVNHINIGGLFNADGSTNENFSILRFRVTNDNISFDIQKAF